MDKKSQIQIGETIAVLFVFFILVAIGFIFYVKVIQSNLEQEKDEASQLRSVGIAQRVMFLPELQCSEDNIITDNCIDVLKLESAKGIMKEKELYYYDMFEYSSINITQIYPTEAKWSIYSKETDDFSSKFVTNVPISLFDPAGRKYGFGVLAIETMLK
ncbi:hypothetical protein HYW20_01500 [Candidatus Woesearchaeota archaeon]|nr:hypothetical protein [Candidatus Woesearchaeota archaeon]